MIIQKAAATAEYVCVDAYQNKHTNTTTTRMNDSCPKNGRDELVSKIFDNDDLVSEIISFLDPQSLLKLSSVSKSIRNCLGYHHVLGSCSMRQEQEAQQRRFDSQQTGIRLQDWPKQRLSRPFFSKNDPR